MTDATELKSRSGIPLNPWYGADGDEAPGQFPFTRGRLGSERGGGSWIQRELSGEGDPAASNAQIRYLISKGQMGIDVIGDSPTMGMLDPDHPLAVNAIGTQGVSLCCKQDYLELFDGLPLEKISVSSSVQPVFALAGYVLAARHAGLAAEKLRGSVLQAPFYGEDCGYAIHMPFDLRLRLSTDAMEFCAKELPRFHSYVEDTYFFAESGLDAVDEMALGFYEIRHITRKLLSRGVPIDSFAPRIAILINCSMDFFEEVAKGRDPKLAANWVTQELFGYLNKQDIDLANSPVSAASLGGLIELIADDTISGKIAKDVFARMIDGEGEAADIVEKHGLKQVTDTGAIEKVVDEIIAANPDQVAQVKEKPKTMGWFVGQVMKASGGKANPKAVNDILKAKLGL